VRAQAQRMILDPRAKVKIREFFYHWLKMEEAEGATKDVERFVGFDEYALADLRRSLELFLDHVVWSEKGDFRQLFLADDLFINDRLAKY
ncbi:DUF1592 domain-containing protein, partial [Listeria monocytogenes]|uniref:DUF1592 domain-containing protein n=1 Tax=Listeria monocytogenes TaxID=1639 RepID=UPI002FDBFEA8